MQATQTRGFSDALRSLGSRGIARGFGLSFLWASPQGAIRMASYETCKDQLLDKFYAKSFGIAVSAVLADFASSVIKVPRELITQRMQTGQYLSSWTAFQSILRQDGIGGLFRGYLSTASRDTPFMVLLFFSYEQFKAWKIRLTFADRDPSLLLAPMKPWSDAETETWIQRYLVSPRFGFFQFFPTAKKPDLCPTCKLWEEITASTHGSSQNFHISCCVRPVQQRSAPQILWHKWQKRKHQHKMHLISQSLSLLVRL